MGHELNQYEHKLICTIYAIYNVFGNLYEFEVNWWVYLQYVDCEINLIDSSVERMRSCNSDCLNVNTYKTEKDNISRSVTASTDRVTTATVAAIDDNVGNKLILTIRYRFWQTLHK